MMQSQELQTSETPRNSPSPQDQVQMTTSSSSMTKTTPSSAKTQELQWITKIYQLPGATCAGSAHKIARDIYRKVYDPYAVIMHNVPNYPDARPVLTLSRMDMDPIYTATVTYLTTQDMSQKLAASLENSPHTETPQTPSSVSILGMRLTLSPPTQNQPENCLCRCGLKDSGTNSLSGQQSAASTTTGNPPVAMMSGRPQPRAPYRPPQLINRPLTTPGHRATLDQVRPNQIYPELPGPPNQVPSHDRPVRAPSFKVMDPNKTEDKRPVDLKRRLVTMEDLPTTPTDGAAPDAPNAGERPKST